MWPPRLDERGQETIANNQRDASALRPHVAEGRRRLRSSGGLKKPIERHIRQHESVRFRCEEIFAVENDPSIAPGTIVTFKAAPEALGLSELTSRLHDEHVGASPERDNHGDAED